MNRIVTRSMFALTSAVLLLGGTTLPVVAAAQQGQGQRQGQGEVTRQGGPERQGRPGGQGGFREPGGGRGGFGGMGGVGGMMGARPLSATNLSLRLMSTYLGLNDSQVSKIALARDDMQEASRMTPPARGGANAITRENMQSMFAEINARRDSAEKRAVAEIRAVLTPEQATKLSTLVKAMESLQTAGFRPDSVGALRLTDEQMNRLARGGTPATVLTAEQMTTAETYRIPSPQGFPGGGPGRRGPGGPGGQRGPGGPGGQGDPGAPGTAPPAQIQEF